MINYLKNPNTEVYRHFKSIVLSDETPWYYNRYSNPTISTDGYLSRGFYSHNIVKRPEENFWTPKIQSSMFDIFSMVLKEIVEFNDIKINTILRANLNCMHPDNSNNAATVPHCDHDFEYKQFILYLTDSGGSTLFFDDNLNVIDEYFPEEDSIIEFPKILHANTLPKENRRIVLVVTYV